MLELFQRLREVRAVQLQLDLTHRQPAVRILKLNDSVRTPGLHKSQTEAVVVEVAGLPEPAVIGARRGLLSFPKQVQPGIHCRAEIIVTRLARVPWLYTAANAVARHVTYFGQGEQKIPF